MLFLSTQTPLPAPGIDPVAAFMDKLESWVWSAPLIGTLILTGVVYFIALKFLPLRYLVEGMRRTFVNEEGAHGEVTNFASLCTVLATTIGTGSIVGVATALTAGGPGALFWMEIAALFGMATKYAEGFLAIRYRRVTPSGRVLGGPFEYIEQGLGRRFKPLAVCFALFGLGTALFGAGTLTQVNSITEAVQHVWDATVGAAGSGAGIVLFGQSVSPVALVTGLVTTLAVAAVILGGIQRIATVATILVPFMALFYIGLCLILIGCHLPALPKALATIFRGAFDPAAVGGGALGTFVVAVQYGISRGIFSNEAGLGSAAIGSSVAKTREPVHQGLITMTSVFFVTFVVCTMTGLTIVITDTWRPELALQGVNVTLTAFTQGLPFGKVAAEIMLAMALVFFAFTTIIGWAFYGERCLEYLTGVDRPRPIKILRILFILVVAFAPFLTVRAVWGLAGVLCGLMALPNLVALLLLAPRVIRHTNGYFAGR